MRLWFSNKTDLHKNEKRLKQLFAWRGCMFAKCVKGSFLLLVAGSIFSLIAQGTITGTVKNASGAGIPNATVSLQIAKKSTTTDANGAFTIMGTSIGGMSLIHSSAVHKPVVTNAGISFGVGENGSQVRLEVFNLLGKRICSVIDQSLTGGNYLADPFANSMAPQVYFVSLRLGNEKYVFRMSFLQSRRSAIAVRLRKVGGSDGVSGLLAKSAAVVDTFIIGATGYQGLVQTIGSYTGPFNFILLATSATKRFSPEEGMIKTIEMPFRKELCINGQWDFQPGSMPAGVGDQGPSDFPDPTATWPAQKIKIPSPWNVNDFYNNTNGPDYRAFPSYPSSWTGVKMAWMRKSITLPADWTQGQRIILHFEGISGGVKVKVNNQVVGPIRFNLSMPLTYDITDYINWTGANELLVGVVSKEAYNAPSSRWPVLGQRTYPNGSMWQEKVSGIDHDVYLWYLPAVYIEDVFVKPMVETGNLAVVLTVKNNTATSQNFSIASTVSPWVNLADQSDVNKAPEPNWRLDPAVLTMPATTGTVVAGQSTTVTIQQAVGTSLKLWTPASPNLYGFVADLTAGTMHDRKYERFGWRSIKISGQEVLLNGTHIEFHGDSWHCTGIAEMTRRYAWAWYKLAKDANLNAVRLHAMPRPRYYMEIADEVGMMILEETGIWGSGRGLNVDNAITWTRFGDQVKGMVLRDRNHPSVLGWSICNEMTWFTSAAQLNWTQAQKDEYRDRMKVLVGLCVQNDSTRNWQSADGDGDFFSAFPFWMGHYGDPTYNSYPNTAKSLNKPVGEGECGYAYYGIPSQDEQFMGDRVYRSYDDMSDGVAVNAYALAKAMRTNKLSYGSVFNLVWYGCKPLPLGKSNVTTPVALTDGILFSNYVEGKPGIQPERIGPYSSTLNPGLDPSLPLYQPRSYFTAIKAVNDPAGIQACAFDHVLTTPAPDPIPTITTPATVGYAGGATLRTYLTSTIGVPFTTGTPQVLVIDGAIASGDVAAAKTLMTSVLSGGGKVFILGLVSSNLTNINQLLPSALTMTAREASSLNNKKNNVLVNSLKYKDLYFAEESNKIILKEAMGGAFVTSGTVLMESGIDDFRTWNGREECIKTAAVLRSKNENPGLPCMVQTNSGGGSIVAASFDVTNP
jgi:hypothetical protein